MRGPVAFQLVLVVCAGQHPGDDPGPGAYAAEHVVRGVPRDHDLLDAVHHPGAQERGEDHVRVGAAAAARVGGAEGQRDQVLPAERGEDRVLGGAGEAGGEDHGPALFGEPLDGFAGAGKRRDTAVGDQFPVRLLEREVGLLGPVLVAEEVAEDGDLGLAHGGAHIVELLRVVGGAGFHAQALCGGAEGLLDEAAVGDGGPGHVEDDQIQAVPLLVHPVALSVVLPVVLLGVAQLLHQPSSSAVVSAMAGEQVMPRPPGPVTSQTPSLTCWRWTTRPVSVHWA